MEESKESKIARAMEDKIAAINASVQKKNEEASQLLEYLKVQRETALVTEEMEEERLKKKGIIIGQHIPSLKSQLDLDRERLAHFDTFNSTLLVARNLVEQNKTNFLRRTGNLPISDLAESKRAANSKAAVDAVPDLPHYLLRTSAAILRSERVADRYQESLQSKTVAITQRRELEASLGAPRRVKRKKNVLSAPERLANEAVLSSINHKLNYLRNPRNDPSGVTRMLVKAERHFQAEEDVEGGDSSTFAPGEGSQSPTKASASTHSHAPKVKYGKTEKLTDNPLFFPAPRALIFTDYDVGGRYTLPLSFRNISAVTRSFRVLPPQNAAFSIAPLKYPANCAGGLVAPGMTVSTSVTFRPSTLGDYTDVVHVDTESGAFDVPIRAQRDPPQLSIPSSLDVGCCLVGDAQRLSFSCLNTGGSGRFKLITQAQYDDMGLAAGNPGAILDTFAPANEAELAVRSVGPECMRVPPFTLYPTQFTLTKDEAVELTIEFVPLELASYERQFFMTCDNGQVRTFRLRGESKQLNLTISELNGVEFDYADPSVFKEIFFPPACVGGDQLQQVVVVNDTGLPVEYEWLWVDSSCADLAQQGQRQIYERERQQEFRHRVELTEGDEMPPDVDTSSLLGDAPMSAKSKQNLLHSLHLSMEESGSGDLENRALGGPSEVFEMSPARGVMTGDGVETFSMRFCPADLHHRSMRAVLMVKNVPRAALPGPGQAQALESLRVEGHGKYPRARSWLEEMGSPAEVDEYAQLSGALSASKNLVNLQTLVHLVLSQTEGVEEGELRRISKWIRLLLLHVDASRAEAGVGEDSSVVSAISQESAPMDGPTLHLHSYDWVDQDQDRAVAVPALHLSRLIEPPPEVVSDSSDPPADSIIPSLREFSAPQRAVLAEVWCDVANCAAVLGDAICELLDAKVKHEAVDYLKESALYHLASLQVQAHGEGLLQSLTLAVPLLEVGGGLSIGKEWGGSFTLVNTALTTAEVELDLAGLRVEAVGADLEEGDTLTSTCEEMVSLTPEYERVLVMPQSSVTVPFTLKVFGIGRFKITLPLRPRSAYTTVDSVVIAVRAVGPTLRCAVAEIDIGLVGVGAEGSRVISFTNESDVPAMYMMKPQLHVDINAGKGKKEEDEASRASTHRDGESVSSRPGGRRSARGDGSNSRVSSARSDDFSVADSAGSNSGFKIELKNAVVTIEPPSGVVGPQETFSVKITCKGGKIPQRIRGLIESRVFDETGKVEVSSQFLNLRGEVQAPKTKCFPLSTNLGQVYVGMPVTFTVSLENMCNLPTNYKLLRPGGDSALYRLQYDKPKGPLGAKERVDVVCTFTSVATGMIDDIIAAKVFGAAVPLAFVVKALSKGILLEFYNLPPGTPVPTPLASPLLTQFPDSQKPPEARHIEPIVIGPVPLYERRSAQFAIRNFSAIPAAYKLRARKFPVAAIVNRWLHSSVESKATHDREDLILAPHEDGTDKFQSEAGKRYIGFTVQKLDDRKFLHSGLGASYLIEGTEGVLPPWGVVVVTISAFNDIPGCYDDEIECQVTEGTVTHSHLVPIVMSVEGCPIVVEKDTVGMTALRKHEDASLVGKQLLHLGFACVNSPPLVRSFYVKNHGSKNGKVRWQVKSLASKMNGPIKMSLVVEGGRVVARRQFWEDLAKDSPFRIEPSHASIPPYGKQLFTVTLFRTQLGAQLAQLTGAVVFSDDDREKGASLEEEGTTNEEKTSTNKFTLSLLLGGDFMHPTITLGRNALPAPEPQTALSDLFALNMKAFATLLFAQVRVRIT
ncbi:hypothetical protein B484DRAFT_24765 [Ochromonadaceae sp. CCMP2298]|nr:hypothetical protein B484DRAFT_24765 [Ochromonadaceae sp. CCMP2298]